MGYMVRNDPHRKVKHFSDILDEKREDLAGYILRTADTDPLRQVTYEPGTATLKQIGKRRVGRPRQNWAYQGTTTWIILAQTTQINTFLMLPGNGSYKNQAPTRLTPLQEPCRNRMVVEKLHM